jgi:serine/threonine protein phosphatase PrpC
MKIKVLQTHKKSSLTYNFVQDKFCINPDNKTIAIADGSTQSFRSEFWAEKLVQEFCKNPTFQEDGFCQLVKNAAAEIQSAPPKFSDNMAIASLERKKFSEGSTSTFLGIQFNNQNTLDLISIGDCTIFRIEKNTNISSFPFHSVMELNDNQYFLNTVNLLKEEPDSFEISKSKINLQNGEGLLLCTDAISRLFLSDPKWVNELIHFESYDSFIEKIEELWNSNLLEEDDITIVYISDLIQSSKSIIPPTGFSFPEPTPPNTFIPFKESDSNLNFSDMDIQTIMQNFNGIKNDFEEVKKKQKFHEILLFYMVGILSIILLLLFLKNPIVDSPKGNSGGKENSSPTDTTKKNDTSHLTIQ